MSFQTPVSKCTTIIPSLGELQGLQYANGVQQFCGISYAELTKRWTRSTLKTVWEGSRHDGTKLGNSCPHSESGEDTNDLVPVPPAAHLSYPPEVGELSSLVMNIVIPSKPKNHNQRYPVMVYVHGGSLLYGGANLPIFDAVNLVSQSIKMGTPIICVNFNYRVGVGGFLASKEIQRELREDGFQGCGNFGFTDQQLAFEWVQRYIDALGGDSNNVTAVGESAGGISISNQLAAASPPHFRRAACMSGLSVSIPPWTMEQHEALFEAVCRYFQIDSTRPDVLDHLRQIPQQMLADATPIIQGVLSGTGNPCLDGWLYKSDTDPREIQTAPSWLDALMLGDTYHEGIIFHLNILEDTFQSIRQTLAEYVGAEDETDQILAEYGISLDVPLGLVTKRVEHMCRDARSRLKNALQGTAYHAHELLYLFQNLTNEMDEREKVMAQDFAAAWSMFCNGQAPWTGGRREWKIWGPESIQAVPTEEQDEETRSYTRILYAADSLHGAWRDLEKMAFWC
ncbi:hypothetical protein CNMCM8812_008764 [Aspergillus fumigatus]|nr:hypothetical protein CNMCM8714_003742 [Aspergillus fumigatus]KAF4272388.1 hypothetical protein CNMCM8812_008764 [Aspergillus fumigatus]KAH1912121.1 hypothetical protein KXW69_008717 [Aspergillus fumigatus]KAH1951689.1 hypothetical protein KXV90_001120 [Aspergillus fumigatus]KAH2154089.1 hypothetical protein KXW33_000662 [Aspergillus fumigatus]